MLRNYHYAGLVICFLLINLTAWTQNGQYDLRFNVNNCEDDQIFVDLEIKASNQATIFELSDQNYRLSFNRDAVENPFIAEELEVSGLIQQPGGVIILYEDHSLTGSSDTIISYNVELLTNDGLELSATDWTSIGRIGFDIVNPQACLEMTWHNSNIFPPIYVGQQVNNLIEDAVEGTLENLNVCYADLGCGGILEPPIANDDVITTGQGNPVTFSVVQNDQGPAGSAIDNNSVTLINSIPANQGTLTNNGNGTLTFSPGTGFFGAVTPVVYEVCAQNGLCTQATVYITVNAIPTVVIDFINVGEGETVTFSVIDNDSAPQGSTLDLSSITLLSTLPANEGTLTNNGDGTMTFAPYAAFFGGVTPVTYRICTVEGGCGQANIVISVLQKPSPVDDNISAEGVTTFNVISNDIPPVGISLNPGSLTLINAIPTSQGTLANNGDGTLTFSPAPGFSGNVNPVVYEICAQNGACSQATIYINVTITLLPTVNTDFVNVVEGETITFNIINNDSAPQGSTLNLSSIVLLSSPPANEGTLTNNGDGTLTFTPTNDFFGAVTPINYSICVVGGGCGQANVVISVLQKPSPVNDNISAEGVTTFNVISNDIPPAGASLNPGSLTLINAIPASQGTLTNNGDGTLTFSPAAGFSGNVNPVVYEICAQNGACSQATIYINVTITLLPTVNADFINVEEGESLTFNILDNDTAPQGSSFNLASIELLGTVPPGEGSLSNNGNGTITFVPAAGFSGAVTPVNYQVCLTTGACGQANIVISVLEKPTPLDDIITTDGAITFNILANDVPPIGSPLNPGTVILLNSIPSSQGILINNYDETITFAPIPGFSGAVNPINYSVCAANGACGEATIFINVEVEATAGLEGSILAKDGSSPLEDVVVSLAGNQTTQMTTGADGFFAFNDLPIAENYTLTPSKGGNPVNGVTAIDLSIAQAHILDLFELSVYDVIAMDVNESCSLTSIDLSIIKAVILGSLTNFPHGKTWKFVPEGLTFPNVDNPCEYDEFLEYTDLQDMLAGQNFIGVKVADVNNSYLPGAGFTGASSMSLSIADQQAASGDFVYVPVKASGLNNILTWQLTHSWDAEILEFQGIENMHPALGEGLVYNDTNEAVGQLTSLWLDNQNLPLTLDDNTTLYELKFRAIGEVGMSSEISTNSSLTPALAYDNDFNQIELATDDGILEIISITNLGNITENKSAQLLGNSPNPFTNETRIQIYVPKAGGVIIEIYNIMGQRIEKIEETFSAGKHWLTWDKAAHYPAGTYVCKFQFDNQRQSIRMIKAK